MSITASKWYGITAPDVLVPGEWLHLAGTIEGDGTISFYVNGELQGQTTMSSPRNEVTLTTNYIGKSNWASDIFEGAIQDLVFVDEVLSTQEISLLANTRERVSDIVDSTDYQLVDNADGRFSIDSEGVVRLEKPELLHDGLNPTHDIKVAVNHPDGEVKTEVFTIDITDDGYNDAPSMSDLPEAPIALVAIDEDDTTSSGQTVASIVADHVFDWNEDDQHGIAITYADETNGHWEVSTDNGANWQTVDSSALSQSSALLLKDTDTIRFIPDLDFNGHAELSFRAWDHPLK